MNYVSTFSKFMIASSLVVTSASLVITPLAASSDPEGVQVVKDFFGDDVTMLYSLDGKSTYFADFESLYRYLTLIDYHCCLHTANVVEAQDRVLDTVKKRLHGYVNSGNKCRMALNHDLVSLVNDVTSVAFENDRDIKWESDAFNPLSFNLLAAAHSAPDLSEFRPVPVNKVPTARSTPRASEADSNKNMILWGTAGVAGLLGVALLVYMNWFKTDDTKEISK